MGSTTRRRPLPPVQHPPAQHPEAEAVATADWDQLLDAVKARLRLTATEQLAPASGLTLADTAARARASVLECVAALDRLQRTLAHELGRRRELEREVFQAQAALAQSRAELVGTQAGERQARHLALHDSLTALPNRSFFVQRLEYALAHVDPRRPALAVLYLDLDTFKPINDEHGHDVGDEVLKIVAARLSRAVRGDDTMSRLGGDEFACLPAAFLSWDQLGHLACKLIEVVSAPLTIGALKLAVHASIGIAVYPTDGKTAAELLKSADAAMYRAKRDRTGYAFFDQRPDPRSWLSGSSGPSLSGSR